MIRSPQSYAACKPSAVSGGSPAQMAYFVEDACKDIATLASVVGKLATLNASSLDNGDLFRLIADARKALTVK